MPDIRHIRSTQHLSDWFRDIVSRREVLQLLVWKELKVQYGSPLLGLVWALFQPVMFTAVIIAVRYFSGRDNDGLDIERIQWLFSGIIIWSFFTNAVTGAIGSIRSNSDMLSKVFFPRIFVILAPVGRSIIDLSIALLLLGILVIASASEIHKDAFILLPIALFGMMAFTTGIALLASIAVILSRHVSHVIPMFLYMGLFLFPVFMQLEKLGNSMIEIMYRNNPVAFTMYALRGISAPDPVSVNGAIIALIISVVVIGIGVMGFRKFELTLSDRL